MSFTMQKRLNDVITDLHEICETLHFWAMKLKSFSHLKVCLATAIHNFKWLKIT